MDWLTLVHGERGKDAAPPFTTGDDVRVWYKILEQGAERVAPFEGIVIRARGPVTSRTFTVRRVTYGEGVERVFSMDTKTLVRIEVLRRGHVKRSRLYFLRDAIGKRRMEAKGTRPTPAASVGGGAPEKAAPLPESPASASATQSS